MQKIGRIESEYILLCLAKAQTVVELRYIYYTYNVTIASVIGDELTIKLTPPKQKLFIFGHIVQLVINYEGEKISMLTRVVSDDRELVVLKNTEGSYKGVNRSHERVIGDRGISVEILSGDSQKPHLPTSLTEYTDDYLEKVMQKVPYDFKQLVSIATSLCIKADVHFIMSLYDAHPPQHVAEHVNAYLGMPILIPTDHELRSKIVQIIANDEQISAAISSLSLDRASKVQLDNSDMLPVTKQPAVQLVFPLIYRTFALGYVLLYPKHTANSLDPALVNKISQLTVLLSAALRASGKYQSSMEYKAPPLRPFLLNVSPHGLQASYQSEYAKYSVGVKVDVLLKYQHDKHHEHTIPSRVVHTTQNGNTHTVSIQFIDVSSSIVDSLVSYLYRKDVTDQNPQSTRPHDSEAIDEISVNSINQIPSFG